MMYLQLAWRYASRRLVNAIAVLALALALAVQIVAMAVLDGMLVDLESRLRNLGEQVTLRVDGAPPPDREAYELAAAGIQAAVPGVRGVTPLVQKVGFLEAGTGAEYVWVQGIDLASELRHSSLPGHLLTYRPEAADPSWNAPEGHSGMFMGEQLARRLGVSPGGDVELFYAERGADGSLVPRSRRFRVTSLFRSGVFEKDRYGIYIPITDAGEFYLSGQYPDAAGRVETLVLWLDDPNRAAEIEDAAAAAAAAALAANGEEPEIATDTWQRRWADAAAGMRHENNLMELVLFLNDAASGFCVFAILVTLVSRRVRDVGLLRCIGASRRGVMAVFLTVGLLIGATGGGLGAAAGLFLAGPVRSETVDGQWRLAAGGAVAAAVAPGESQVDRRPRIDRYYEAVTGQPLYPPRMFGIAGEAGLPIVVYPWKLAAYFLAAVVVSVLAAVYPAGWAAAREPMSALREG